MNTVTDKKITYLIIIFLIIASCTAFSRIKGNDFVDVDDMKYITQNQNIQSGFTPQSIHWAFTSVVVGNWHPLTMLTHMLDWTIFGPNPAGHHLVNLLLHIGAVILLFLFLYKTTHNLWPSAFAAALFALHPLRVESVAWAAERKDVLSMFLGMACLYAYAFWAENHKKSYYLLCLFLFALSLLSKPMMVTLPFVLMLLDYWPLNRIPQTVTPVKGQPAMANEKSDTKKTKKQKNNSTKGQKISLRPAYCFQEIRSLLWEKVPFIGLIIPMIFVTLWAQNKDRMVISLDRIPFMDCLGNAIVSYAAYLGKIFWPMNMAVFYPFDYSLPLWKVFVSAIIMIVITLPVLYYIKKLPFLFVGWFWYLGTMIPVIGLVKAGNHAIADRYTYLPSIGIMIMLMWGIQFLFPHKETFKRVLLPAGSVVLMILAVLTWQQCGYWKHSIELWNHTLKITTDNYLAHNNLAVVLANEGKYEDACYHYDECIRIHPDFAQPYNNRGNIFYRIGQSERAIKDYSEAIRLKPDYAKAYYNRGLAYLSQSDKTGCSDAQRACSLGDCQLLIVARKDGLCI